MSLSDQLGQHTAWRRDFAQRLKHLAGWLRDHDLLDAGVAERLELLQSHVRDDKVVVAFVAEFSRGKSELINAIFFSGYGRRIMPASAGRTTMCPTELGWNAQQAPGLRLLPIETRLQPVSLAEWRDAASGWEHWPLDPHDPEQVAQALAKVAEVRHVDVDEARALGLWHDDAPDDNPRLQPDGRVEVPRWRHALINLPHPLLQQGLVILDTPGLNAIGAEPELTVSLIPQAHAVLFILGADTGVTRSDLAIWRDHLGGAAQADARMVVLNKIDMLWDVLRPEEEVRSQIERQRATTAEILELPTTQVLPVSAHKGLLAKIENNTDLLVASGLPTLELALAHGVLGRRQRILQTAVQAGVGELEVEVRRALGARRRQFAEHRLELQGLRGKNSAVIRHLGARVTQEQAEFNASATRLQAVRSVHLKHLGELMEMLGAARLKAEMAELTLALRQPGLKLGVKKPYADTFARLRANLAQAQQASDEIQSMLDGVFRQLNAELGFTLHTPRAAALERFQRDLDLVERSHMQYLGLGQALRLAQSDFAERLVRALGTRLRVIHESALSEVELWNKSAAAQLDTQLRERRRNFSRRLETLERIQQAAAGLDERIADLQQQEATLDTQGHRLADMVASLVQDNASVNIVHDAFSTHAPGSLAA